MVTIDKDAYKKILAPKEEDCFPDYHPRYKTARTFAFMPLNHPNRLDPNPVIYYQAKPLPDFASVVVSMQGTRPKVSVWVGGMAPLRHVIQSFFPG